MMQNGRISSCHCLDLACPQAKADNDKYVHMFRGRGVDKTKYRHEGIMIIFITTTYCHITPYAKVTIHSQGKV